MLKLEKQVTQDTIKINDTEVTVYGTIGTYRKVGIIATALKQSTIDGIYNRMLFDAVFHTTFILEYTDIEVEGMATLDIVELHDIFETNGVIASVINALNSINKGEFEELSQYADMLYDEAVANINSAATTVQLLLVGLSQLIEESNGNTKKTISKAIKEQLNKKPETEDTTKN